METYWKTGNALLKHIRNMTVSGDSCQILVWLQKYGRLRKAYFDTKRYLEKGIETVRCA